MRIIRGRAPFPHGTVVLNTYDLQVRYKPVQLARVFAHSGALPLAQRPKCRLDYRLVEIKRWAKKRGLPINPEPRFFPTDPALADRTALALIANGHDPGVFIGRVLAACWAQERNIAEPNVVAAILADLGFDAEPLLAQAETPAIAAQYERSTEEAIANGVVGVPFFIYRNEPFWGQDRLELLAERLAEEAGQ